MDVAEFDVLLTALNLKDSGFILVEYEDAAVRNDLLAELWLEYAQQGKHAVMVDFSQWRAGESPTAFVRVRAGDTPHDLVILRGIDTAGEDAAAQQQLWRQLNLERESLAELDKLMLFMISTTGRVQFMHRARDLHDWISQKFTFRAVTRRGVTVELSAHQKAQLEHYQRSLAEALETDLDAEFAARTILYPLVDLCYELDAAATARQAAAGILLHYEDATNALTEAALRVLIAAPLREIKILNMDRPLDLERTYVKLRVTRDDGRHYVDEPTLRERFTDPNTLLELRHARLVERVEKAITPEDAVRQYRRCVVLGDPGAGKTTMLKHLALCSAQGKLADLPDLPFYVELRMFTESRYDNILDYIADEWRQRGFPDALPYIIRKLRAGAALLLFDGLDEVNVPTDQTEKSASGGAVPAPYRQAVEAIAKLDASFPDCRIVVTSRQAGYRGSLPGGFHQLEVLDFRSEDIEEFIANWFAAEPQKGHNLSAALRRNSRLAMLGANPLLLSLIAIMYEQKQELPEKRDELYKYCVEVLLTEWDSTRGIRRRRAFSPTQKRGLLKKAAWHFHRRGMRYFPKEELLQLIAEFLTTIGRKAEESEAILVEIAAENGLLKEQAVDWYGFLHLTLQEYFAAAAAAENWYRDTAVRDTIMRNLHRPWWEEVILLLAGLLPDASPLIQGILDDREDIFHSNLLLAGRCLAAKPTLETQPELRGEIVARLKRLLLSEPHYRIREQTALVLIEIRTEELTQWALNMLRNGRTDNEVGKSIAKALGQLGVREVATDLLTMLPNEWMIDWRVRKSMAAALGQLGVREVATDLLTMLSDERIHWLVRERIAMTLGQLETREVAPDLLAMLSNEQIHRDVRNGIAAALGQMEAQEIAPDLLAMLSDEQINFGVREHIAAALGQMGAQETAPALLAMLSDKQIDECVRASVAEALGQMGAREVVANLLAMLPNAHMISARVCGSIADALGRMGVRETAPALLAMLRKHHISGAIKARIARALGQMGARETASELLAMLSDRKIHIYARASIAAALGQMGAREAVPKLLSMPPEEQIDEDMGVSIAKALGQIGAREAVPELLNVLSNKQANPQYAERLVCKSTIEALGKLIDTQDDAEKLARFVDDEDIGHEVYGVLWQVSRRVGVRVFREADGRVVCQRIENHEDAKGT